MNKNRKFISCDVSLHYTGANGKRFSFGAVMGVFGFCTRGISNTKSVSKE